MKHMSSVMTLVLVLSALSVSVSAQTKTRVECAFRNGSSVEMDVVRGKIVKFTYSGYARVNRSVHECYVEAERGNNESKWADSGSDRTTLTFARNLLKVTIKSDGNKYSIAFTGTGNGDFCGAGVSLPGRLTVSPKEGKYVGRILM